MKKLWKVSASAILLSSFLVLSCSNPTSPESASTSANNGGGTTASSGNNPGNNSTNPDNPSGGGDNPVVNPDPIYEWLQTKYESLQENHSTNYDLVYTSTSNYTYSYYNSNLDYSNISLATTNRNQTINEISSNTETQQKTVVTYSLSNNMTICNSATYNKENESWIKISDYVLEADQESGLVLRSITRTYNNNTIENENIYEYSIELLSNDGEIKRFKHIQTNQTPISYSIREIKNGNWQKDQTYNMNDVIQSEMIYHKSSNTEFNERLPEFYLYSFKSYSNGTLVLEYDQEITIISIDDNKLVFEIAPTTNTLTSFQKSKYTYERKQVPLSNTQQ